MEEILKPGLKVEILEEGEIGFIQRQITPEEADRQKLSLSCFLVNTGHSEFIPGWETGVWIHQSRLEIIQD